MRDSRVWFGNVHRRSYARFHLPAIDFRFHGRALCGTQLFHRDPSTARGQHDGAKISRKDVATGERFGAYERADFFKRYPDRRCEVCEQRYRMGGNVWRD